MRALKAGCEIIKGGIDHTPGSRGGAAAGESDKVTP